MQIIHADPARMIDLPDVGPCPRPVDIDQSVTGFTRLKSLRIYRFRAGVTIAGDSEGDEVYIVPFGGTVQMQITGVTPLTATLSAGSESRALYMAPDHSYRLTPGTETLVAYARASAVWRIASHVVNRPGDTLAEALSIVIAELSDGDTLANHPAKDRLIHVVSGAIVVAGRQVTASQTAAFAPGQNGLVQADGLTTLLVVSA